MTMTNIVCSDSEHASRQGQPGWQTVLGTTDLPTSPPGYLCDACAAAAQAQAANDAAVLAALAINQATIQRALVDALPALRTMLTQAQTMKSATVSNVSQAQAQIRAAGALFESIISALIKANRLLSNQLDGTT